MYTGQQITAQFTAIQLQDLGLQSLLVSGVVAVLKYKRNISQYQVLKLPLTPLSSEIITPISTGLIYWKSSQNKMSSTALMGE
jgi:hypothetical protein